jgi:diguanylate cyclase (GGDEF)-like protein
MARKIDAIDALLQTALHEGRRLDAQPGMEPGTALLAELTRDLPYVETVKVTSPKDGRVLFNLNDTGEAGDGIDLEVERLYREHGDLRHHVSRPRRDGASRTWLAGISRAGPAGTPGTSLVATAHVDIEQLQHLFEEINTGRMGTITLWRSDGMVLARKPYEISNVGRTLSNAIIFEKLKHSPVGDFETISAADGIDRIVAYRALPGTSLIMAASVAKEEVLAPWKRDLARDMSLVAVAVAVLVLFGASVAREARRRGEAEARAQDKSAVLEATLENMDQGLIMFDADLRAQVCNHRALELLDLPADLMSARPHFADIKRFEFERGEAGQPDQDFDAWLQTQRFERTLHTVERERSNGTVLEIRTAPIGDGGAVRTYTDITARKEVERRIAHMARHDALTGLPNRVLLRERVEEALTQVTRDNATLAVLCLDLDQFKGVNDTLGHPIGDALLKAVAERIRSQLSDNDTIARLGGDEFAILQVGAEQPQGAKALAGRIVQAMPEPVFVQGHKLNVGASVGIALAPSDGLDPDWLLKCADLALYRAKAAGRDTFRFFEAAMDTEAQTRRVLELDMRDALGKGEFHLHYQPFMDISRGEVVGLEALVRWQHPGRGLVSPDQFIPIAEENGLIVPLGEWIIRQACADAARFPAAARVAVNVSVAQFRSPHFVQTVVSALASSKLPPHRLELEITETVLMQGSDGALKALHQLRSIGVRIALDDFGTGYSSLSYLSSFPFDKLKIDRSFVRDLGDSPHCAAIVRAIIGLGASLGICTTAEGVETPEQLDFLREAGCTEAQGYLLSLPKPANEAVRIFERGRKAAVA